MNFQTSKIQSRLRISSTVARVALAVALTLSASGAMAASANVHKTAKAHAAVHVAARQRYPRAPYNYGSQYNNVGQLVQSVLGGGWPALYANLPHGATRGRSTHGSASSSYDNSPWLYDPPASVDVDNSQSQAAIDASDQATQQVDQDTFQMDESLNQ